MTSRRSFLQSVGLATLCTRGEEPSGGASPLREFRYSDVELAPGPAQAQFEQTCSVLMSLNEDSLLKPWRLRAGLPAPGPELGGWYDEVRRPKAVDTASLPHTASASGSRPFPVAMRSIARLKFAPD